MSFSVFLVRAKTLVQIRGILSLLTTPLLTDLSGKTLGAKAVVVRISHGEGILE